MALKGTIFRTEELNPGHMQLKPVAFCIEKVDYTNGGNTIAFPADTFKAAPYVECFCVLKNLTYSATAHVTACVTALTKDSITIRANKGGGPVVECATDDVTLHLMAYGNPGP